MRTEYKHNPPIPYMSNRNEMSIISIDDSGFVDIIYCEK